MFCKFLGSYLMPSAKYFMFSIFLPRLTYCKDKVNFYKLLGSYIITYAKCSKF